MITQSAVCTKFLLVVLSLELDLVGGGCGGCLVHKGSELGGGRYSSNAFRRGSFGMQ